MMAAAIALPAGSGLTSAVCSALSLSRASVLRHRAAPTAPPSTRKVRAPSSRALPERERDQVLQHLREPRFPKFISKIDKCLISFMANSCQSAFKTDPA